MTNRINYKTRRAIVNAIINETKDHGDAIRPLNCERWDDITIDEYEPHCPVITGEIIIDLYDLADLILDEVEVAVVPGEAFGPSGFLRLSYALSDDDIVEGVGRIQELLG